MIHILVYWVSGPQFGLDPNLLSTSGWRECYNSTYATSLSLSVITTILTQCRKTKLLLACKPASTVNYTLAAMGVRSDVLFNCATVSSCTRVANGVAWYFSTTYSWGFAQAGDPVSRSSCDTNPINPTARLCWHTNGGSGYRCGSTTGLHSDTNWIRSIWHADWLNSFNRMIRFSLVTLLKATSVRCLINSYAFSFNWNRVSYDLFDVSPTMIFNWCSYQ